MLPTVCSIMYWLRMSKNESSLPPPPCPPEIDANPFVVFYYIYVFI